jgi:uncharacterized membrane protein YfhO
VNGKPSHIYKVDGYLRGVTVSPGENRIVFQYRPAWVLLASLLTAASVFGTILIAMLVRRKEKRQAITDV